MSKDINLVSWLFGWPCLKLQFVLFYSQVQIQVSKGPRYMTSTERIGTVVVTY